MRDVRGMDRACRSTGMDIERVREAVGTGHRFRGWSWPRSTGNPWFLTVGLASWCVRCWSRAKLIRDASWRWRWRRTLLVDEEVRRASCPKKAASSPRSRVWTASCPAARSCSASRGDRFWPIRNSRGLLERCFSVGDGVCGVAERGGDVLGFEGREFSDDLLRGHAVGNHAEHGRDGDPQSVDARDATQPEGSTVMRSTAYMRRSGGRVQRSPCCSGQEEPDRSRQGVHERTRVRRSGRAGRACRFNASSTSWSPPVQGVKLLPDMHHPHPLLAPQSRDFFAVLSP